MATPSEAEVRSQLKNAALWLYTLQQAYYVTSSTNLVDLEDTADQAAEGEWAKGAVARINAARKSVAAVGLSQNVIRSILDPIFREYARIYSLPQSGSDETIRRVALEMKRAGTPVTVKERAYSYGSPADPGTPSNAGTGTINRIRVDDYGYNIEYGKLVLKKAECVRDSGSGAIPHEEEFTLAGGDLADDGLPRRGCGPGPRLKALSARDSQTYLSNPSFSQYAGTAASPTELTDWTVTTDIANFNIIPGTYYRDFFGDVTSEGAASASLEFTVDDTITQNMATVRRAQFSSDVPYYFQYALMRKSSCDGTMTFTVGGSSVATDVSGLSNNVWNVIRIALGSANWYRTFNAANLPVSFALASRSTGTCYIDDVVIGPMTPWDGSYYAAVGGATKFLKGSTPDRFTWTDSIASDSKVQKVIAWGYNFSLPPASSPVITDP